MNIATIGTSWITEKFISACHYAGDVNVLYCYSREISKAEAFALKTGGSGFTDSFEKIAEDNRIDAVYIASPNVCHYEQTKFFLEHGKNVITEKPSTTTLNQTDELNALAEKNGLVFCEAIMSIHTEGFRILRNAMNQIGNIRSANLSFCQLSSKYPAFVEGRNPNIFNPDMHAGCLMDIGVYNLYLASALFGMPDNITSSAQFLSSGADACGGAVLSYPDKTVTLTYSKVAQGFSPSEIHGDKGTITIASVSQLTGIRLVTKDSETILVPDEISRDEIMAGEINFLKNLLSGNEEAKSRYAFAREAADNVRRMSDIIRTQNNFRF